jgi:hypothetical protein
MASDHINPEVRDMGWASGSRLMDEVIAIVKSMVKDHEARKGMYGGLIAAFEADDCDTLHECLGVDEAYDEVFLEMNPHYAKDTDEEDAEPEGDPQ